MTLVTLFLPYLCALQLPQCNKFVNRLSVNQSIFNTVVFIFYVVHDNESRDQ